MKNDIKPIFQMMICAILWSIAGIFIKLIPWDGLTIASLRAFFAMCFLLIYMNVRNISYVFNKKTVLSALLASGTYICFCIANKLTTAANVIVLQFTAPLFILIYTALIFHEKIQKRDLAAVLVTLLGLVLCFVDSMDSGKLIGNLLSILAGAFFAGMMVCMGNISTEERFSTTLNAQLLTFLIGLPSVIVSKPVFTLQSVICIIILGVFQMGLAFIFYIEAAGNCSALTCCLISVLEPLLNPIWVMIFNGEKPGTLALIGEIIVIITVTVWSATNPKKEVESES